MKNRLITIIIVLSWAISNILIPLVPPAKADELDWTFISSDNDNDGLPNQVELGGWCNTVGCFITNSLDPDSDDDGLTDGEEKLFELNPDDSASPGIYVIYEDPLKTKEYYPWQPYGHKLIARGDAVGSSFKPTKPDKVDVQKGLGTNLNAVIVRRGATIYVGGPISGTLQINKSISSLSNLTATKDPYTGEWQVTVPSSGTLGKYTLTIDSHSIDLFVIFELPTPSGELTQTGINKFLYDDNPNTSQDTTSVLMASQTDYHAPGTTPNPNPVADWWDGNFPPYNIPSGEVLAEGGNYAFSNYQYNRFILEDYVIPAINGQSNRKTVANALVDNVDANTAFHNPRALYNSWDVLKAINSTTNKRNQCSGIAGAVTALSRAVGIPSRVLLTDWHNTTFDHANEIWLNGEWRAYRGYNQVEVSDVDNITPLYPAACNADHSIWPQCGDNKDYSRYDWGRLRYRPYHSGGTGSSNLIVTVNDTWTGTNTQAYRWPSWITAMQFSPGLSATVLARGMSMTRQSWFETQHSEYWGYWGWTGEPAVTGSSPQFWPQAPAGGSSLLTLAAQTSTSDDFQSAAVQLGDVVAERALDTNGNGKYDQLVLDVTVTAAQPGQYWLRGELSAIRSGSNLGATGGVLSNVYIPVSLVAGSQTVPLVFEGANISLGRADGPYLLSGLWITNVSDPGPTEFMNDSLAYRGQLYTTKPYKATEFQNYGAALTNNYKSATQDSDGNGSADTLIISTKIEVSQPDNYTVEGSLYDGQGNFISQAKWSGAGSDVNLVFENISGNIGPYTLQEVNLLNAQGDSIDRSPAVAYTIASNSELSKPAVASLEVYPTGDSLGPLGVAITPTNVFTHGLVDGNLQMSAEVNVAQAGSYKLEAWLADTNGNLVTWAVGQPTGLAVGLQKLFLTFDGKNIRARGVSGPYKVVALKVLDGNASYNVLDKVDVAFTTIAYTLNQFASSNHILLEDAAEIGAGSWSADPAWSIQNGRYLYMSQAKAWEAKNADALLTLASPFNLSAFIDQVALKFRTSHKFGANEAGYVEVSTNPNLGWTPVATYTGSASWSDSVELIDLSDYADQMLHLRFRLDSAGGSPDAWYINNVVIADTLDSDGDHLSDEEELNIGTDPNDPDSDSDGMSDGWEVDYGFNPLDNDANGDADGDGLSNLNEFLHNTNPNNPDTDGDTMPDNWEVTYGLDPLTNDTGNDLDNDGLTNLEESTLGTYPNDDDSDNDTLTDGQEFNNLHTDPTNPDSDGDGINDGVEVGVDPNNPSNTDGDGAIDALDPDSDNDAILDVIEGAGDTDGDGTGNYQDTDSDGDGLLDSVEGIGDNDGDGIPNYLDNNNNDGPNGDADGDTILNKDEDIPGYEDADGDGILNKADPDSDNDGISDSIEAGDSDPNTLPIDTDGDGLPDFIEPGPEANRPLNGNVFLPIIIK